MYLLFSPTIIHNHSSGFYGGSLCISIICVALIVFWWLVYLPIILSGVFHFSVVIMYISTFVFRICFSCLLLFSLIQYSIIFKLFCSSKYKSEEQLYSKLFPWGSRLEYVLDTPCLSEEAIKWGGRLSKMAKSDAPFHSKRGTINIPPSSKAVRAERRPNFATVHVQWWRLH